MAVFAEAFESLSCSVIVVTPCVLDDVFAVTAAVAVDSLFDPEARLATLVADDVLSDHSSPRRFGFDRHRRLSVSLALLPVFARAD